MDLELSGQTAVCRKHRVGTAKDHSQKCAVFDNVGRKDHSRRVQATELAKER